ncbi:hypothetical protein SAMN05192561_10597 [Halopenitus malekzadehii]|uniref:Uncharacterized protein n=1 Tax=Halopenitus malekzadehii TaxID=1267564 RepID=A0A1H6IVX1_9EURY|nr:hypothetical protein [Halopenitus malekzadehii]SEH53774.1 hypothetical protein SAMN05192561_10597 [Halopenitus malekzadehii]
MRRRGLELIDSDLSEFGPSDAEKFFKDLLEAAIAGVNHRVDTHLSANIHEPDGGIDAEAKLPADISHLEHTGLLPTGRTGFEIKSTRLTESECRTAVLDDNGNLKPYLAEIIEEDGNYVLVTFGHLQPQGRTKRIEAIQAVFEEKGFVDINVDVYSFSELLSAVNHFPSLIHTYGPSGGVGKGIEKWADRREIWFPQDYVESEAREEIKIHLRNAIHKRGEEFNEHNEAVVCRVQGISGLGKTRLVYETVSDERIANLVIYVKADQFIRSELAARLENDDSWQAIVVLDDCSGEQHREIYNRYRSYDRLAFITISDDFREVPADLRKTVRRMKTDELKQILNGEFPDLPGHTTDRFARISDGFPEMALLLASNSVERQIDDSILEVTDSIIFERLLVGSEPNAPNVTDAKRIITPFAFFNRVHWHQNNPRDIAQQEWLIEVFELDEDYSRSEIQRVVKYEKDRGVLQGDETLSLRLIPLAAFLMKESIQHNQAHLQRLLVEMPASLQSGFVERIPYSNTVPEVQKWSKRLLREIDWFTPTGLSGQYGWVFRGLVEITPNEALIALQEFLGSRDQEDLERIEDRRVILESLRRIAVWENCFFQAAELLRRLALAENDYQYSNNSTGIFVELFTSQLGPHSPTEVPPSDRLPILLELFDSESKNAHRLCLECAEHVLSFGGSRGGGIPHRQGAKRAPDFWEPDTSDDVAEYLITIWKKVEEHIDDFDQEHFDKAVDILVTNGRRMAKWEIISPVVRETYTHFLERNDVDTREILTAVGRIVEDFDDDCPWRDEWVTFEKEVTYRSFHTRLHRFVGVQGFVARQEDRAELADQQIGVLAEEAVDNPELLRGELEWLHKDSSENLISFGEELGKRDPEGRLIPIFLDGLREVNEDAKLACFGAYLGEIVDECCNSPRDVFSKLRNDEQLISFFPFLVRRADPTVRAVKMIFRAVRQDEIPIGTLQQVGTIARNGDLDEDVFLEIGQYLLNEDSGQAAGVLVNLAYDYYRQDDPPSLHEDMIVDALTHNELVKADSPINIDGHWYEWEQLTKKVITQNTDCGFQIANAILSFKSKKGGLAGIRENTDTVLRPLFKERPAEAWDLVSDRFEDYSNRIRLQRWFAGTGYVNNTPGIFLVPPDVLWEWTDIDPANRAPILAECVPRQKHDRWWEITRGMLVRYGEHEEVFHTLSAVPTGSRMGGDSLETMKQELQELLRDEESPLVRRWLNSEIKEYDQLFNS